ncbi:MAG: hypothetical protein RR338_03275 [Clostridia bacterium]
MINKEKLMENWDELKDETKTKILALADKEVKDDYFVPKEGEVYYYYEFDRITIVSKQLCYCNSPIDEFNINTGNCFKAPKEAIFAGDCDYYTKRFETYVNRHSEKLDWDRECQTKWYVVYSHPNKCFVCNYGKFSAQSQGTIYASSQQILKDAIADIGEENFLKYVMNVEK